MKRAAIYARFSSDRQNERSCHDQIDLCTAWAERQGIEIVATYDDSAISGASKVNRAGLAGLMRDARARRFDIVLAEALDRLSRDQADLAGIKKDLAFLDIAIMTVQDGLVGAMHIGLKGLMGELYLADLSQKTHRGQSARVRGGGAGGGRSYGYQPGREAGEMSVIPAEADVVRRIFEEYAAGETPRAIARELHDELGQSITAVAALAGAIVQRCTDNPAVSKSAEVIRDVASRMHDDVRALLTRLRPPTASFATLS